MDVALARHDPSGEAPARAGLVVVCALPAERRALRGATGGARVLVTGMGAAAAARGVAQLLSGADGAPPPRALLGAGFCGALDPALRVGDVVAAEVVHEEATGASFPADPGLLASSPGRRGTLVSASRIARTPADRARLRGTAVDLESAALARAAAAAGVPFLALHAVTDEAGHRLPDFDRLMDAAGRLTPGAGLLYFVRRPRELPALVRLGPASRRAGSALAEALAQLVGRVA